MKELLQLLLRVVCHIIHSVSVFAELFLHDAESSHVEPAHGGFGRVGIVVDVLLEESSLVGLSDGHDSVKGLRFLFHGEIVI